MITYLLNTLVDSIKTSLINKLGLDPSTEVDLDDFPQLIDDIPILDSVEELTVTQNGTYTGTGGVTYNPVNVNLPLDAKTVTANGTYSASDDSLQGYSSVTVDIDDTDAYKLVTDTTASSVKTLTTAPLPFNSLKVGIEAVQDLHGYDHPWAGGAGKNKLPMTVDGIKTANTSGTWSGNVYSINNGTFTILTDSDENVTGIKVNGTFSASTVLNMDSEVLSGDYVLNGCPSDGGSNTYRLDLRRTGGGDVYIDSGSGVDVSGINESVYGAIRIQSGYEASNITFYPMLRPSTETDPTFEPYSNYCPITGWDSIDVYQRGKNLYKAELDNYYLDTATGLPVVQMGYEVSEFIPILANQSIYIPEGGSARRWFYDKFKNPKTYLNNSYSQAYTAQEDGYIRVTLNKTFSTYSTYQIEYGNTATPYEPYNGQTHTTALSTTCYGGSKDIKGNERFTHAMKLVSNCTWYGSNGTFYTDSVISSIKHGDGRFDHVISSAYKTQNIGASGSLSDGEISVDASGYIQLKDLRYSTAIDFKTAMGTTQLLYELATPTTATSDAIDLTLAEGVNNLWADSGDVGDARYFRKVEL